MKDACIIGYGMVGKATAKLFGIKKHFDRKPEDTNITLEDAAKCRVVFICLPTPQADGKYKTGDMIGVISKIKDYGNETVFVIRSTVDPGFADYVKKRLGINVISNPEFLTEATWENDIQHPPFVLLGGRQGPEMDLVRGIYESRIKSAPIIVTDNITAEMAKLALNGFFTTKVVYANEIFDLCQTYGANYQTIKKILEKHPFGYKNHAEVYHKGGRGAGGKCLEKDMAVLASLSSSHLLSAINEVNQYLLKQYPKNEN